MNQIILSTTGTAATVTINDLFGTTFIHPTNDLILCDITNEQNYPFTVNQIRYSTDLQTALNAGYITLKDEGTNNITNIYDSSKNTEFYDWIGSSNITTLGTIVTGTWNATAITWTKVSKSGSNLTDIVTRAHSSLTSLDYASAGHTGFEKSLTISTGLTRSVDTITANISTGISGGQSIYGGTAASNNLTIYSTSNGTKGNIILGTTYYDEVNNRLGIDTTVPTARLHLPAGTATANTAPIKLTAGTGLTVVEDGALEYHNSHLYFTIGSTRHQLDNTGFVDLTISSFATSGAGTLTIGVENNRLYSLHLGTASNQTANRYIDFIIPDNYVSGGTLTIKVYKSATLDSMTMSAYIESTVDATINTYNINPTLNTTIETKTVNFGSALTYRNYIMVQITDQLDNNVQARIYDIYFTYNI